MQLQSLGEPPLLKTVETVQQAVVEQVQGGSNDLDGNHGEDLALHQEDDLHHNGEGSVSNHHRYGHVHKRTALGRPEGQVRNILEPDGVDNLGQPEERQDQQDGGKRRRVE